MTSTSTPQPIGGHAAQFGRMMRALERARAAATDRVAGEDELVSFFMHAWHLKDHVKNDSTLTMAVRRQIEAGAHGMPILKVCRDVANGLKHSVPKPSTVTGGRAIVAVDGGQVTYYSMITLDDGTERRALDLANEACQAWREIFTLAGLPVPT